MRAWPESCRAAGRGEAAPGDRPISRKSRLKGRKLGLQSHVLEADDPVGVGLKALELLGKPPQPSVVVEKNVRPVVEVDLGGCRILPQPPRSLCPLQSRPP